MSTPYPLKPKHPREPEPPDVTVRMRDLWRCLENKHDLLFLVNVALEGLYGDMALTISMKELLQMAYTANGEHRYTSFQIPTSRPLTLVIQSQRYRRPDRAVENHPKGAEPYSGGGVHAAYCRYGLRAGAIGGGQCPCAYRATLCVQHRPEGFLPLHYLGPSLCPPYFKAILPAA